MRKIDLTRYATPWRSDMKEEDRFFDVKESLIAVLFNNPGMTPRELLKVNVVVEKVEQSGTNVLLEDAEYDKLVAGLEGTSAQQLTRDAVEFVRRVYEAPQVSVEESGLHAVK